jgi:hypothetical protein
VLTRLFLGDGTGAFTEVLTGDLVTLQRSAWGSAVAGDKQGYSAYSSVVGDFLEDGCIDLFEPPPRHYSPAKTLFSGPGKQLAMGHP